MTNKKYPNFEPDPLGDLKEIKRTPKMQKIPPTIRWGDEYKSWPIEKKLKYAERLACAMNHAADILQQERNELLKLVQKQEIQLEAASERYLDQNKSIQRELCALNVEQQDLNNLIVKLKLEIKDKDKRILELEKDHGNHN